MADDHLEYTNMNYRNSLVATLGFFLLVNLYALVSGNLIAAIPVILQAGLLITIYLKWSEQRILIKFWAALMFLSGIAGMVGACAQIVNNSVTDDATLFQHLEPLTLSYNVACIAVSIYYYRLLPRSTKIVEEVEQAAPDSMHAS